MNDVTEAATYESIDGLKRTQSFDLLVMVFKRDDLQRCGARHILSRIDAVQIGRGQGPLATRVREGGKGILRLSLDDGRISSQHAVIEHVRGAWVLEDQGSRNGSFVNGERVERQRLHDGDAIEVGQSFFVFRSGQETTAMVEADRLESELKGKSPLWRTFHLPLATTYEELSAIAATDLSVLVLGQTGSGKERIAEGLHTLSHRTGPLVPVNCATLDPALADSALFGHRRGAFTGAAEAREGFIRRAEGGTLFLDELAELPAAVQSRLLRVLETREVIPVGADGGQKVDFRLVAATHETLGQQVDEGSFRSDLHARLSQMTVGLPSLAERPEDLGILIRALLNMESVSSLGRGAAWALLKASWPQNVRQLRNALIRAATIAGGPQIELEHCPPEIRTQTRHAEGSVAPDALAGEEGERRARLIDALRQTQGNVSKTAETLGLSRNSTHRWLKKFKVDPENYRGGGSG